MNLPKSFPFVLKRGNTTIKIYRVQNGDYAESRVVYYNTAGERRQRSFTDYLWVMLHRARKQLREHLDGWWSAEPTQKASDARVNF